MVGNSESEVEPPGGDCCSCHSTREKEKPTSVCNVSCYCKMKTQEKTKQRMVATTFGNHPQIK